MKILYAVQGTGNGHITRAQVILPELKKHSDVDVLISGFSYDLNLPFPVKYKLKGMSFCFGKGGGIDYLNTLRKNKINRFGRLENLNRQHSGHASPDWVAGSDDYMAAASLRQKSFQDIRFLSIIED